MDAPLPQLGDLIEIRVLLLRSLAESLEVSQSALLRNDAETIARGAARQAELCRQWSLLEDQLRREFEQRQVSASEASTGTAFETTDSKQLEIEFTALTVRIRYLARVHWSLLRHLQRSMAVLQRVYESCQPTYTKPTLLSASAPAQAGD